MTTLSTFENSNETNPSSLLLNAQNLVDTDALTAWVIDQVEEVKGQDITVLDVKGKSSITNIMIIVTGTSSRHVASMADQVLQKAKENKIETFSCSGKDASDWMIIDFGDAILHLMQKESRDTYALEKLWS